MKKQQFELEDYLMSSQFGCLLEDPHIELPPFFEAWQKIANSLPRLYRDKSLRDEVHKLPLLDHTKLEGYHQLCLAHMQLTFICTGYVWQDGDSGVTKSLPKSIAIPLHHISKQLGIKPIISHIDVCLSNWNRIDSNGPLELENMKCVCHIPGGQQGDHFCLVTAVLEMQFARSLKPMVSALSLLCRENEIKALEKEDETSLLGYLGSISDAIGGMKKALGRMYDGLDAHTFFNEIRPFLAGWGGSNSPLPDGLIFEGVSNEPVMLPGGSAAQSTSLQALDAFFGITHTADEEKFLKDMRHYMPPLHARFIEDIENNCAQFHSYVKSLASPAVREAYNKCLAAIIDFRSFHIGIVSTYILSPSRESNKKKYESLDEVGTGGSDLLPFLRKIRSDTKDKIVDTKSQSHSPNVSLSGMSVYFIAFAACVISIFVALMYMK